MSDPHVGKLTYFRVYSRQAREGRRRPQLHQGPQGAHRPHPADARQPPRGQGRRLRRRHRRRRRPQAAPPPATRSATPTRPIVLESLEFPEPVIHVAVEPKTKADQDKLGKALMALSEEDPTFQVHTDEETGQTIIGGMGELHLEVLVDRMLREFKVDANVGKPQVAYRETITAAGREGRDALRPPDRRPGPVRPRRHRPRAHRARAAATSSSTRSPAASSPRSTSPRSTPASRRRCSRACWPATPWSTCGPSSTYGSYHDVDSSEMAFKIAGSMALQGSGPAGQAGAARADHGGRGRHPRGLHGRRHRRPLVTGGARSRAWSSGATAR